MKDITFTETEFLCDGKPFYLNSGEFHYYRVPKADWKRRMLLLKEAGGNTIATYIPWILHEPEEGRFVIDQGDGFTDLTEFLECAKEVGLYVIARPGPYVYSEIVNHGLPHWLLKKYPETLALRRNGKIIDKASVSYVHPLFLEKARNFYRLICPYIAKYTVKNGGPIAVVQLDNELTGIHVWYGDRDFHPVSMGFGKRGGRYPEFLKARYGTVAAANRAYGTKHGSFLAFSPKDEPASGADKTRWNRDYVAFYNSTITDYLIILMNMAQEFGIDAVFCHNAANPWMNFVFRDLKKRLGRKFLIGTDHYYLLSQTWEQNNPTPQYLVYCFMSLEVLRLLKNPPSVFESQYGSIAEWPHTAPEDVEAMLMFQLGSGGRGHNGYVFTGGPNPPGLGTTCDVYDYDAPVAADGKRRPTYHAIKRFGDFVAAHPELACDRPDTDIRVAIPWENFSGAGGCANDRCVDIGTLTALFQKGTLSCLFAAGLQPELVDPDADDWARDVSTPVLVNCDGSMPADRQARLAGFIRKGGRVILQPVIPELDENFRRCTVLADAIGATSGAKLDEPRNLCRFGGYSEPACGTSPGVIFTPGRIPAGAATIGTVWDSGKPIAWRARCGKGTVVWCGMHPILLRTAHVEMYRTLFAEAGGKARWTSDNTWVVPMRRRTAKGVFLYLANLGTSKQTVHGEYLTDQGKVRKYERIVLPPMSVRTMYL